jgi:hypothetical protein
MQDEVANGAAANGADGHSALADRLDAVLHVPPQYQVLLCLAAHVPAWSAVPEQDDLMQAL